MAEDEPPPRIVRSWLPRRLWLRVIGAVLAVGLIATGLFGLGQVHLSDVAHTLERISGGAIALATLAIVAQMLLVMTRLWFLFPSPRPRWPRVAYGFSLGQVVNNFLPVRTGDLIKVMLIAGRDTGRSKAEMVGVMIADTLIDMIALAVLVLCIGPSERLSIGTGMWPRLALAGGFVGFVVLIVLLVRKRPGVQRVLAGLRVLRNPVKLVGGLLLSMGNWTTEFLALHWLAAEVGGHLGFSDAIRVLFLLNLAIVFPVSVANLGTFELPIAIGLTAAGLAFAEGLAIGTAYHGLQIFAIALLAFTMALVRHFWPKAVR